MTVSSSKSFRAKIPRKRISRSKNPRGQAGIYMVISLFLTILVVAFFTLWSLKTSELSSEDREQFTLSLEGKRIANILDIVERNKLGFEAETQNNISFSDSLTLCDRGCIQLKTLPLDQFQIRPLPNGVRIEK